MLTPTQIAAQSTSPALTDVQILNLSLLVKQFPLYAKNQGLFPDLQGKLEAEQDVPTVKTQVLKAVLVAVDDLPEVVVESQGRESAPAHFATGENWNSLALDVLNVLYDVPAGLTSPQSFAMAQRKVEDILITDDMDAVLVDSLRNNR